MNEAAINVMSDALVSAGRATPAQAAEWKASDLAALKGDTPSSAPAGAPPNAGDAAIRARADDAVARGEMTREQADAALAQYLGVRPAEGVTTTPTAAPESTPAPLTRSDAPDPFEGVELESGFGPPAKPEDYRFDLMHADPLTFDQLKGVAETFHAARMPAPIATQIYSEIVTVAAQKLDANGVNALTARTMAQLQGLWGDRTAEKINTGRTFLQTLEKARPGVLRLLKDSGAGSSYAVVRQIVEHAERINAARRK